MLFIVGIVFLVFGLSRFKFDKTRKCIAQIDATMDSFEKIGYKYYPIYKYIVDGNAYFSQYGAGIEKPEDADLSTKVIFYNPNDPSESFVKDGSLNKKYKKYSLFATIYSAIGIGLCLSQIIILLKN